LTRVKVTRRERFKFLAVVLASCLILSMWFVLALNRVRGQRAALCLALSNQTAVVTGTIPAKDLDFLWFKSARPFLMNPWRPDVRLYFARSDREIGYANRTALSGWFVKFW
jgi:hypothetical protein